MSKIHYAVRNKARIFALFDQGKRPSDIGFVRVSRRTLYQYFWEWRKERGIEGKKTGFAVKPFDMKAHLKAKKAEESKRQKEPLVRWVRDYQVVVTALKEWAEGLKERETPVPRVYLPVQNRELWLNHLVRHEMGQPMPRAPWREQLPIILRNIDWFEKWIGAARKAPTLAEFKDICTETGIGYPPEIEEYREDARRPSLKPQGPSRVARKRPRLRRR